MTQPPEHQPPAQPGPHHPPPQLPAQPPASPYGPGPQQWAGAPSPYPPPKGNGGKIAAIVIAVVLLVVLAVCGGTIALIVWAAKNVDESFADWDPERPGGRDNPIAVSEGEAFEIDGIEYGDGWRVVPPADEYSGHTITGLSGENDRDDESGESAYLSFTFVDANDNEIGQITCSSDGTISHGRTEQLECTGYDEISGEWDEIEVSAS